MRSEWQIEMYDFWYTGVIGTLMVVLYPDPPPPSYTQLTDDSKLSEIDLTPEVNIEGC